MITDRGNVSIAVVIPVYNRRDLTLQCLHSLRGADQSGLEVRIYVVDDGSTDGTSEAIHEQFPAVIIVPGDGNLWYTAATNRGIQAALAQRPDYVLAINDDQVFHPHALQRLVRCARQNRRSVVGGLLLDWERPEHVMATGVRWSTWYGGWRHPQSLAAWDVPRDAWEVGIIVGNCVLYPTEAIEQVGLMNEAAFPMLGDAEYSPRMRRVGWKLLIEPSAYVWCQPNSVTRSLRSLPIRKALDALLFDQKNGYNLIRQFRALVGGAPSPWLGFVAYVIHVCRLGLYGVGLAGDWPNWPDNDYFISRGRPTLDRQEFTQALAVLDSLRVVSLGAAVDS